MNKKRILFTGGGTAGHVIVNLALIPHFQKEDWIIDYIGSENGIERDLIKKLDKVSYHSISTGKLRRYMSKENFKDPFKVIKGIFQAWKIIGQTKPAVLFSKGGFVSVPVILAAKLRRVPIVIHESDYTPGLANKLAIPFAKKVLITFPETLEYVPHKKTEYVGAVIREELFEGSVERGLSFTGLTKEKPIFLIMGGSGGSKKINEIVRLSLPELLSTFQVIHICGKGNLDHKAKLVGYTQFEYVNDELKDIFAITNFVLSRAGSNAIFEFLALRLPMLLIPLSLASSRGDQIVNAQSFSKSGYANILEEENLTTKFFLEEIYKLKDSALTLQENMKDYQNDKARDHVINTIKKVVK